MPKSGDSFIVRLKNAHLKWGEYDPSRHSRTRGTVRGEAYIQIPSDDAYSLGIFNQNNPFGENARYKCTSYDGMYTGCLLAQGNQADPHYAKQFSESGHLKGIGGWYRAVGAIEGDYVKVKFTSPYEIIIEHSRSRAGFHI